VVPQIRPLLNGRSSLRGNDGEEKMLRLMFFQMRNEEYDHIHRENAIEMQKQFQALKKRLGKDTRMQYRSSD
jgi:molybdate-binding protein